MGAWVSGLFKSYGVDEAKEALFRAKNESDVVGAMEEAWGCPFLLLLLY